MLTKEVIEDAIVKSKATSISGVWKALGHQSNISGGQGRKIKELLPNCLELLEQNKGVVATAEKTVQPVAKVVTPKIVNSKVVREKKAKGAGGFRAGSSYETLYTEGNKSYATRDELVSRVAKITGKTEKVILFSFYVMSNTTHKSNGGRAKVIEQGDKVKIVAQA